MEMNTTDHLSIYLIIEFNWPQEITPEMAAASAQLHREVVEADWVDETLAGYGGIGDGKACIWILKFSDYSALNAMLNPKFTEKNGVTEAYSKFFGMMIDISTRVKHEVLFLNANQSYLTGRSSHIV
ncbi:MAG: hypothetical protein ACXAE3_04265 [Candidatus Kariarchaeaceae archaeon]|jgi:hypothetical protein